MPKDNTIQSNNGGQYNSSHAAGTSGSGTALTGPGRLCKVTVLTAGTGLTPIYDGTSGSGTHIFSLPTNPTVGQTFDLQIPVSNGIYFQGVTTVSHGVCLTFTKNTGANGD